MHQYDASTYKRKAGRPRQYRYSAEDRRLAEAAAEAGPWTAIDLDDLSLGAAYKWTVSRVWTH
jgi:hypothetical protein